MAKPITPNDAEILAPAGSLEAFFAAKAGLDTYGRYDPETASKVADLAYKAASRKRAGTKDSMFKRYERQALDYITTFGGKKIGSAFWTRAGSQMTDGDYKAAITALRNDAN